MGVVRVGSGFAYEHLVAAAQGALLDRQHEGPLDSSCRIRSSSRRRTAPATATRPKG